VGGAERAVAALFARARAAAPAVVFFDELDGLAGARGMDGGGSGGEGGGPGERVLAQLLMELDGLQARLGVVVLAATNRPDRIDAALLRPGRFDRLLHVPPPDAAGRAEVFRVRLRGTPLAGDVDIAALAAATAGYTGADVGAVCREAALAALDEDLGAAEVAARHFESALARVRPSAGPGAALEEVYREFERAGRLEAL
jgi:SpoVK/Ycf46/Vps4 family AAA+-type ATPase